ncbi:MAG: deoxyribodipyrimidine photo-lyase [Candidatus Auribacterota bacterium]
MIHKQRIQALNNAVKKGGLYVVYWMQASQRAEYNHALEYAIREANKRDLPLVVFFGITDSFPEANERHYFFMLEGLRETQETLAKRSVKMVIRLVSPEEGALALTADAALLVVDRGYLRIQKQWREYVAHKAQCPVAQVETDVLIPVETACRKEAYSAAVIRRRIDQYAGEFLKELKETKVHKSSLSLEMETVDITDIPAVLSRMNIDRSVRKSLFFTGGASQARALLDDFIKHKLDTYDEKRNDPADNHVSNLSPYLHFGQISPLFIALQLIATGKKPVNPFLEEMVVRRELSMNFTFYNAQYDSLKALPDWAMSTLDDHRQDARAYMYSLEEFEQSKTHDPYWNAAQTEMVLSGKMHGYMRMYWGKKILEWSQSPEEALKTALYLNNKYELDGRDPNAFTGVLWCFGKHDRPWRERDIFGKIRYMSESGLARKFNMEGYVERVNKLKNESLLL